MRKKLKKNKKRINYGFFWVIVFFLISYSFTSSILRTDISNEEFIRLILSENNPNIDYSYSGKGLFIKFVSFVGQIDLKKPFTMIKNNYVFKDNSDNDSDLEEIEEVSSESEYINDPYPNKEINNPIIYIYNTHQLEEYQQMSNQSYNVTPNVMMASYILREKLGNKGITSLVEENNVSEILKINNWNYASSYKVTKLLMEDAKVKNPSLKYFIDLHRDSVSRKISTTTINNKSYAKILFIVGLENANYQKNLDFTNSLQLLFEEKYPGLSRGIYKKQGSGVNGVYNQDFNEFTILIEVGGAENTIEEVYNTIDAIADILSIYIGEKNEKE